MYKYAGIGSRETPSDVLETMQSIGQQLAELGWLLRSGGAGGADTAFEIGCNMAQGAKEIFIPWNGFSGRHVGDAGVILPDFLPGQFNLAGEFHPNWTACSQGAKRLHARNLNQIAGQRLDDYVDMVVCWTKGAKLIGGTAQAIRMAIACEIPVFNLADEAQVNAMVHFVDTCLYQTKERP